MGLSVWRETSKKLTVYRVCYTPIETLLIALLVKMFVLVLTIENGKSFPLRKSEKK